MTGVLVRYKKMKNGPFHRRWPSHARPRAVTDTKVSLIDGRVGSAKPPPKAGYYRLGRAKGGSGLYTFSVYDGSGGGSRPLQSLRAARSAGLFCSRPSALLRPATPGMTAPLPLVAERRDQKIQP